MSQRLKALESELAGTRSTLEAEKRIRKRFQSLIGLAQREWERTAQLKLKSNHLEEANMALRLMLKAREEDRQELGEKIISNVKHLVLPYIEKLKNSSLRASQNEWLRILSANIEEIISPFAVTLSASYINLSPREIQTANLVKNGKTNKEIAGLWGVSLRAIEFHRENIRKKFGLVNKKTNLRSHLLSLD